MELAIDRRQNRELFWFLMHDREFFEDLSASASGWSDFRPAVEEFVPADWMLLGTDIWLNVFPPQAKLPLQGFKIHISATSATATEVLRRVVPIFVANNAGFKIMADPRILEIATCKNYWRGGSGKFVTVYPKDSEHFAVLAQELGKVTNDLAGPYILSDKRVADNKVLFYRYGGFAPRSVLNLFGEKVMVIESSDGTLVPDIRTPFFQLPEGIEDPFPSDEQKHEGEVCLNNRYRVKAVLTQSNSGGVYTAEDQQTGQTVVIKEARPFVNVTRSNTQDSVATLRSEAGILKKLEDTGYVPKVVDLFQEWEHVFLVQEYVEGLPLSSYRALNDVALVLQNDTSPERVKRFCDQLYEITEKLIRALQAFHREGIVIGDLSPHNIMVNTETLELKIIDFEAARQLGESGSSGWTVFTPGFASSSRLSGTDLSPQDDFYSLGSVIYSIVLPVQELFGLKPEAGELFINEITEDFGLPPSVKELIFALLDADVDRALTVIELAKRDGPGLSPVMDRKIVKSAEISRMIDGIANYILSKAKLTREDRLWPSDYRLFSTNPLSIAYGALGTALFLKTALGEVPATIRQWIQERPLSLEAYPPGLFVGLSGIAWVLQELRLQDQARRAIDLAFQSPLLFDGPDLFYGAAGTGLASLYFFRRTGEGRFLAKARELGDSLISKAASEDNGCYWTNVDGIAYLGYAHGGSGIALFLLYLHLATGDPKYLPYATAGLEYEISHASIGPDQMAWGRVKGDSQESPYWRLGTSGVGSALIRFHAILGDSRYKELAEKAASSVAGKYTVLPSQFMGLSGIGEFLIDMYYFTGERKYLGEAFKRAEGVFLFQIQRPEGIAFPGEELLKICTDYGTGSAGIGMFLLRLLQPKGRLFYEFGLWDRAPFEADTACAITDSVPELVCQ